MDNIISVAATDSTDHLASFSDYGIAVSIAAPGVSIASTVPTNNYGYLDGTSMATPFVAGAISLLRSLNPQLSYLQTKNILLQNVDTLPSLSGKVYNGGRLNIFNALQYLYVQQLSGISLFSDQSKQHTISNGAYFTLSSGYVEWQLAAISGHVSSYLVQLNQSGSIIQSTGTAQTGITLNFSGNGNYEVQVTPLSSDKNLTGTMQMFDFILDATPPTATVTYLPDS